MRHTVLVVPGYRGSGPGHWQTWLEHEEPDARRPAGVDWESPVLARWGGEVRRAIDAAPSAVWVVAHSFGCLASTVAIADRPAKVAGAVLVAPADPARFTPLGLRDARGSALDDLTTWIPSSTLACPSVVVASRDDPWVPFAVATRLAAQWGARCVDLGNAGHINVESGFGPWPFVLDLLRSMRQSHADLPLGHIDAHPAAHGGRHGALARIRHWTRHALFRQGLDRPRS